MTDILWPLVTLCIALLAYHTVTKSIQLKHGLMLAADRAPAIDRQVTALQVLAKQHESRFEALSAHVTSHAEITLTGRREIDALRETAAGDFKQCERRIAGILERFAEVEQRSENTTANVATFINETRDQIEGLRQRETMALAGLNAIGRKGIRTGTP